MKIQNPRSSGTTWKAASLAVGVALMAILLVGTAPGRAATGTSQYDDVQLSIQTSTSGFSGTYTVSAYNQTGYAVATYQGQYAAASFELPGGSYIFTVSASDPNQSDCIPVAPTMQGAGNSSSYDQDTASCDGSGQGLEYGYAVQQVSGPETVQITTQPTSGIPTANVTVRVDYLNGTAVVGASVYASPLGAYYGWDDGNSILSAQTGTDGTAVLTIPAAPTQVTAWNWLPITLPQQPAPVQVDVGGEEVNVTLSWEPSYIGLAGSAVLTAPQGSCTIVLQAQQPDYWVVPGGVATSGAVTPTGVAGTASSGPGSVPASLYQQTTEGAQGSSATTDQVQQTQEGSQPTETGGAVTGPSTNVVIFTLVSALALAVSAASFLMVRRKTEGPA